MFYTQYKPYFQEHKVSIKDLLMMPLLPGLHTSFSHHYDIMNVYTN